MKRLRLQKKKQKNKRKIKIMEFARRRSSEWSDKGKDKTNEGRYIEKRLNTGKRAWRKLPSQSGRMLYVVEWISRDASTVTRSRRDGASILWVPLFWSFFILFRSPCSLLFARETGGLLRLNLPSTLTTRTFRAPAHSTRATNEARLVRYARGLLYAKAGLFNAPSADSLFCDYAL